MKGSACAAFAVALISTPGWAMDSAQYQDRINRLDASRKQTEALLERLSSKVGGFDRATATVPSSTATDRPLRPLFVAHDRLRTILIPSGKILYGTILNRLVVGPDGSPVLIKLDSGQNGLSGARLKGMARQSGTEGRVSLELDRLLLATGKAVALQGLGLDESGAFGLSAEVVSGKALAVGGSMAASFITGLATGQQSQSSNAFGFSQVQPSGRNAILQGVAQTAADQSKRLIEDATQEKPVLLVSAGTPVAVLIDEEVRF